MASKTLACTPPWSFSPHRKQGQSDSMSARTPDCGGVIRAAPAPTLQILPQLPCSEASPGSGPPVPPAQLQGTQLPPPPQQCQQCLPPPAHCCPTRAGPASRCRCIPPHMRVMQQPGRWQKGGACGMMTAFCLNGAEGGAGGRNAEVGLLRQSCPA